jgi:shikimate dehydrogenase
MKNRMENIILIGMPGCGKSTIGRLVAEKNGRTFVDIDAEIEKLAQKNIPSIFAEDGEEVFRDWETMALDKFGKESGLVIATGGGCVTKERNYPLLHQNGTLFWLQRDLKKLATEGRPLSTDLEAMYQARREKYVAFADDIVDNNSTVKDAVSSILK